MDSLSKKMEELKKPNTEGITGSEEVRDLGQAIKILRTLQWDTASEGTVVWKKLKNAMNYLEDLQKNLLADPDLEAKK